MTVCPRIRARLDSCAPQQGAVAGTGSGTRRGQAGSAAVEAGRTAEVKDGLPRLNK